MLSSTDKNQRAESVFKAGDKVYNNRIGTSGRVVSSYFSSGSCGSYIIVEYTFGSFLERTDTLSIINEK